MSLPPPPFDLSPTFLNQPTPLEKAGQIVSKVLESDGQFPDLADLLKGSTSERYANRVSPINEQDFVKYGAVYIPQRVADDIDQMACRCFMGILPEINRAWVTVDHRLFLWNYTDGSDVYIYDDQDQIICSVGLAKPKPGVFNDYISHILIIATPLSISIIGVAIQPRQKTQQLMLDAETLSKDSTSGTLALYATDLVVPSDGVQMSKIVSTDEGRIFMVGDDGRLYELEYHQPNSWFMKKCRLVPRTAKILSNYVPSFLKPKGSEIKSVAIDNERKVMYLLSNASTIEVIYLGPKGDLFATVARNTDIGNAARLACRQNSVLMEASDFELESIHVISKAESKKVHLVAITTTGYRLYFSHHKDVLRMTFLSPTPDAPPNALELVHVRLPPPVEASGPGLAMQGQQRQNGNIRATYYGCGTLLAAKIVTEESDTLLTIATDYGEYANPRPPQNMTSGTMAQNSGLIETASTIDIEGKMLDIAEIPHRQGRRNMNEICEQLRDPCRQFIILTEKGLTFVRKQRPVDILLEMLRVTHGDVDANQPDFIAFFERYGQAQTCAVCLDIICANFGATSPELVDVIQGATKLFFDYGGSPVPSRTEMSTSGNHLGRTPGQPTTIYSGKHDGFALYFARLVSSVWKLQVLQCSPDAKTNGDLRQYQSMLLAAQRKLSWLKKFMDANEDFHSVANIADARQHTSDQTMLRIFVNEQQSLHGLYVLLSQCIEAISFLDFLIDASIPEIMQCVPEKLRSEMSNLSLELMLSTDQGRALTRELVLAAIEKYGKTDMYVGFDVVSAVLQQKCSCFFGPSDVAFYKGIENLKRASLAASEGERKTALAESLSQFKDAAHTLSDEKLYDVCRSYCDLAFHAGAVELCVVSAQKIDPHEEALAFVENRTNFGDPRPGQLYQLRRRCYQLALAVLKTTRTLAGGHQIFPGIGDPRVYAAQVLSVALAQKDRLFHYTLYEWMIKEGRKAELLNVDNTTYLIPYFKTYVDEVESKDFLWQYYRRHGRYYEAALYLESLATQPSNINLEKRIEFLSLAIINARCRDPNCQELQESTQLLQSLEQKIGVARIQLRLKRILKSKGPEGEAAAQVLDGQLLDLNALFHDFARRFQLEDMTLVIKEFADNPDLK